MCNMAKFSLYASFQFVYVMHWNLIPFVIFASDHDFNSVGNFDVSAWVCMLKCATFSLHYYYYYVILCLKSQYKPSNNSKRISNNHQQMRDLTQFIFFSFGLGFGFNSHRNCAFINVYCDCNSHIIQWNVTIGRQRMHNECNFALLCCINNSIN